MRQVPDVLNTAVGRAKRAGGRTCFDFSRCFLCRLGESTASADGLRVYMGMNDSFLASILKSPEDSVKAIEREFMRSDSEGGCAENRENYVGLLSSNLLLKCRI